MQNDIFMGILRHVLTVVGMWIAQKGYATSEMVDAGIGALLTLGALGWSVNEKMTRPSQPPVASPPAPTGRSAIPAIAILALALTAFGLPPAFAEGVSPTYPRSPAAVDWVQKRKALADAPEPFTGYLFASVLAGYNLDEEGFDKNELGDLALWSGGGAIGYLFRAGGVVTGVEADAMRRLENVGGSEEIDNWTFTARGLLGLAPTTGTLIYATAGLAYQFGGTGLVYGAGGKYALSERTALRLDVLQFDQGTEPIQVRFGMDFKF